MSGELVVFDPLTGKRVVVIGTGSMARPRPLPMFPERGKPRARKAAKLPSPREIVLHKDIARLLKAHALPSWRWTHFPASEKRDVRTGAKLKAMGLQPGWPDFLLVAPAGNDNRPGGQLQALEAKRQGEDLGEEQSAFAEQCKAHGVPHAVVDRIEDAAAVLSDWGVLRVKVRETSATAKNPAS